MGEKWLLYTAYYWNCETKKCASFGLNRSYTQTCLVKSNTLIL